MRRLAFIFIFLITVAHAQDSKVALKVKSALPLDGGITIYALSTPLQKKMAIHLPNHFGRKTIQLPVGVWEFFALGFKGKYHLEGPQLCGYSKLELLSDQAVELTMNPQDCAQSFFGQAEHRSGQQFFAVKIFNCDDLSKIQSAKDTCGGHNGPYFSYLLELPDYALTDWEMPAVFTAGNSSMCLQNPDDPATGGVLSPWHLPLGAEGAPLSIKVSGFPAYRCVQTPRIFEFDQGLLAAPRGTPLQSKVFFDQPTGVVHIYLR